MVCIIMVRCHSHALKNMGLQYSPEDQKNIANVVMREVAAVDTKNRRELLAAIHDSVYHLNADNATKVARAQARFATLLVALSEQADKTTQENLEMQRKLVRLTWALFILTVALTFVAAGQLYLMLK